MVDNIALTNATLTSLTRLRWTAVSRCRLTKELSAYEKEAQDQLDNATRVKASDADDADIRQAVCCMIGALRTAEPL